MATKAGRSSRKFKIYRRRRWVDGGDGVVHLRTRSIRRRRGQKPPRKDPGPRPLPRAQKPRHPARPQPFGVYRGPFGRLEATRLLNRAGFGPAPGQAEKLARMGLRKAVLSLTRPKGQAKLIGPDPVDGEGLALAPYDSWGHDHLWWLDRMVRTNQPFKERMALVFHDWFATSNASVSQQRQMIDQYWTLRAGAYGTFDDLVLKITRDPAMLQWLNGGENNKWSPNENYARELMELFTLGADRGAYTENDVREAARALTGWRYDWDDDLGAINFRYDPEFHDDDPKTIFGKKGGWGWKDVCRLCVTHRLHASFFVDKLWSYFVPAAPSKGTRQALIRLYLKNGRRILPVVEAILQHPDFYRGPPMVKPPVVFNASLLRALGLPIQTDAWTWLGDGAGQQLFLPPNVAGWDDERWLDTSTVRARWLMVTYALDSRHHDAWDDSYRERESTREAVNRALARLGWPALRSDHQNELVAMADRIPAYVKDDWQRRPYLAMRQNALLQLIASSPDFQLS
ncbi:MAG: DUF1800 domain-containing protein [Solirubrobacterales bacterium]|nr:DUF1800 domain-containing protein [Solirubrobacterales bacterium]